MITTEEGPVWIPLARHLAALGVPFHPTVGGRPVANSELACLVRSAPPAANDEPLPEARA